jgi:heptosyltransferase-1
MMLDRDIPKKVLVVKTSSLGDVIHTLPALSDAVAQYPGIKFDWVVEEAFQEIPRWHPNVQRVIPIALRRWRKHPYESMFQDREWQPFLKSLRAEQYDLIIDAQGLLKSAWVARLANGRIAGLNYKSAREPLASLFYHKRYSVLKNQHAVTRVRQLFAQALGYEEALPGLTLSFGLDTAFPQSAHASFEENPYVLFLHGTTWETKLWPLSHWIALGRWMNHRGYTIYLPWGNAEEEARAKTIAAKLTKVQILPRVSLGVIAEYLRKAALVIALDSGLTHLAGALSVPTVALFGATDVEKTGPKGKVTLLLKSGLTCSPCLKKQCRFTQTQTLDALCMQSLSPTQVWQHALPYLPPLHNTITSSLTETLLNE